ncbi:hypothetical protein ACJJTC_015769 [Scirpophaga incertulas]
MPTTFTKPSSTTPLYHENFLEFLSKPMKSRKELHTFQEQFKLQRKDEAGYVSYNNKNDQKSLTGNDISQQISNNTYVKPNEIQGLNRTNVASIKINNTNLNSSEIQEASTTEKNYADINCTLVIETSCEEQRKLFDDIFKYPVTTSNLDNDIDIESTTDYESTTFDDIDISIRIPPAVVASLLG